MRARGDRRGSGRQVDVYGGRDPRAIPVYPLLTAAGYLRLPPATLRSWIAGRLYETSAGARRAQSLIQPAGEPNVLSFWNLAEAFVLAAIRRQHGVPLQKVRKALTYVERELDVERPLIRERFRTDGVDLFVERWGQLLNASKAGQLAFRGALEARLQRIAFDERGLAARLFPFGRSDEQESPRAIEIDPRRGFGRPLLAGTSITADVVLGRFRAGESSAELAKDYAVDIALIEEAIRSALPQAA
ncbi:MAG: DUF433 domain-containing protein [Deltaproteobacteria bacterium]|nr:DUF433 domain-containing protein [Deltaproteobacteria bacterium]